MEADVELESSSHTLDVEQGVDGPGPSDTVVVNVVDDLDMPSSLAFDPLRMMGFGGEKESSQEARECRICQEEASAEDGPLVAPCVCAGSMRFIHPRCLQRWINEKGDAVCEVCKNPFQGEWEVPIPAMSSQSEQAQEQLLAAFAQGMHNARLRSTRATPQQQRQARFARAVEASISVAMMVYMSLFLLHVASTGDSDQEVPRVAQALEGMMTLLLQVVYVSMTMLFAMHVIATLLYRVGQRAWSQVYSSPDEAVARREVSVQREAVVQRVVDLRGAL